MKNQKDIARQRRYDELCKEQNCDFTELKNNVGELLIDFYENWGSLIKKRCSFFLSNAECTHGDCSYGGSVCETIRWYIEEYHRITKQD